MFPNSLIVTVISARQLSLKSHSKLDVFASLTLSGNGSWKEKVQTDVKRTCGDCSWEQGCLFDLTNMHSSLTVTVNYKTVIGITECLGGIELTDIGEYRYKTMPVWFKLRKKGKFDETPTKNRGEICLKFYFFSQKLSTSTPSVESKNKNGNDVSFMQFIGYSNSPSQSKYDFDTKSLQSSVETKKQTDLSKAVKGKLFIRNCSSALEDSCVKLRRNSLSLQNCARHLSPAGFPRRDSSRAQSIKSSSSMRQSVNSLNCEDEHSSSSARPRSLASSGFSSARSTLNRVFHLSSSANSLSKSELIKINADLRDEIEKKDDELHDLYRYVDQLVVRVMESNSELLKLN